MISSEVQRTLVKSPPELWAELSDPAALARHLGELGEIRIVRTEPERVVEWAAEHTTGVVSIKPSGWGTRVTLCATRERILSAPAPEATSEPENETEAETAGEGQGEPAAEPEVAAAEPEIAPAATPEREPEPRRGFFARLFRRRHKIELPLEAPVQDTELPDAGTSAPAIAESAPTPTQTLAVELPPDRHDAFAAVRQVLAPETFAAQHPFAAQPPAANPAGEPSTDIAAELMAAEDVTADEVSAAEVTAVLTAVLDRLGAAHHRPFSRG
jgi:hypothetical protein